MRVSVETTNGLERKVTVAVPADSLQKLLDEQVQDTANKVKLPGFRAGKVPLKVVRQRYGEKLRQEAASSLLQTSLQEAVAQERLSPAGAMNVDIVTLAAGRDFEYTATFEVLPEFDLVPFNTLRIRAPRAEIAEADIDRTVEQLRQQRTEWQSVERPARIQDRALYDYSLEANGEILASREGLQSVVDDSDAEINRALLGMSVTETRTFPVTLPAHREHAAIEDDHEHGDTNDHAHQHPHDDQAEGDASEQRLTAPPARAATSDVAIETRNAIGKVTLRGVDEPQLPDLDDAFFDWFGVAQEGDRLATFRSDVRARMEVELDTAVRRAAKREVLAALVHAHDFEVPKVLLEAEIAQQKENLSGTFGSVPESFEQPMRKIAEEVVRSKLVVRAIAKRESITADDERVAARAAEIASGYEQQAEVRRFLLSNEEQLSRIEADVLQDHVVEKVLAEAEVTTVELAYADVIANVPLPDEPSEESSAEVAGQGAAPAEGSAEQAASAAPGESNRETEPKPRFGKLRRFFGGSDDGRDA